MNEDPIVAEVRRIRERHASRFGHDIHKIFADLRARNGMEDLAHPTVKDAEEWGQAASAENALTFREEPPRKD